MQRIIDDLKAKLKVYLEQYAEWYEEQESQEWGAYGTVMAESDGWMRGQIDTTRSVIELLEREHGTLHNAE